MKVVITVIGQDKVGIIAGVSKILANFNVNILDISQTTMQNLFTMIMLADMSNSNADFSAISKELELFGESIDMQIKMQREEIFNNMHKI